MIKELKVGDKVYIREDLKDGEFYGSVSWQEGNMKVGINTIISVYERGICISEDIGYFYDTKMIDWEKTRELNAKDDPTFDDLIDVAVKAVRDKVLSRYTYYNHENGTEVIAPYVDDKLATQFYTNEEKKGIDWVNSLYTETFVIESLSDIEKIKLKAKFYQNGHEYEIDQHRLNSLQDCKLFLLKGATVTQKIK